MVLIQITAYLRDEQDLSKWKALSNKTEFLHNALNPTALKTAANHASVGKGQSAVGINPEIKLCKHGADSRFCRHAKAGKECK